MLNPKLNENNFSDVLSIGDAKCFLPGFIEFHKTSTENPWPRTLEAYRYVVKPSGVEASNDLPSLSDAYKAFDRHGIVPAPLCFDQIERRPNFSLCHPKTFFTLTSWLTRRILALLTRKKYSLSYPLVGSYSDLVVVSKEVFKDFAHYCGIFAATRLFAEIAIPTALVLAAKEIVSEKDIQLRGRAYWVEAEFVELEHYQRNLTSLLNNFPPSYLYIHPVKLSQWKLSP